MAICYQDVSSAEHQAHVDELDPGRWRIAALSVSGAFVDPRYAAVWVERPGPDWRTAHDIPEGDFQKTVDDMHKLGYDPVLVSATGVPGQVVFAAVFVAGGPLRIAKHGLYRGDVKDPLTLDFMMQSARDTDYVPRSLTSYGNYFGPSFAGVWVHDPGCAWAWDWGELNAYQRKFDALKTGGLHPSDVSIADPYRLAVFTDDHIGSWWANHNMPAPEYERAVKDAVGGLRPVTVQANAGWYATTFAADDIPKPKNWRVEGPPIPAAAELDDLFARVMKQRGVRAASVAVAKGGTTYLKRAYTWAEDDWPTTTTSTTFRVASVSKLFTAAAIKALADDGVISLNASVFGYLRIPANGPQDPVKDSITILQCATSQSGLPLNFEGNATFRDISIGLGRQATIRDLAAHIYTVPQAFPPGMKPSPPAGSTTDTGYSNSAFHLLGAVVEQATGMSLVAYIKQRLTWPGVQDLAAGFTAAGRRLPGEVAGYEDYWFGPSQLDLAPDAIEARAYGGDILLDSAPGSGGLVTSPASVARFLGMHAAYGIGPRAGSTRYGTFVGTSAAAVTLDGWDFSFATNREIPDGIKDQLRAGVLGYLGNHGSALTPFDVDERFPIRGVLLVGGFRTQAQLNAMTYDEMRNTMIVELTRYTNQPNPQAYQGYDNLTLAGMGAAMVFFRRTGIRDDAALQTMSPDDQRNTLIVEVDAHAGAGQALQGFSTLELALIVLGSDLADRGRVPGSVSSWSRGVLLLGGFRTQRELNQMSHDEMRNTLIVELTNRTNQTNYQAYNEVDLAGIGAVLVLMRALGIRDDAQLRTMSADDMRNTLIVELNQQTGLGDALRGFSNLELARTALGDRPPVFRMP